MKYYILATATFVAALAFSTEAMKITGPAVGAAGDTGSNLRGCGDDCNVDSDCDSSCPHCFLGGCVYFGKGNATDHKGEGNCRDRHAVVVYDRKPFGRNVTVQYSAFQ